MMISGWASVVRMKGIETLAETAYRESQEETAWMLDTTLNLIKKAEEKGHYVDFYNEKTNFFYRMYCVKMIQKVDIEDIRVNAKEKDGTGR